jgi:hypothetical protein
MLGETNVTLPLLCLVQPRHATPELPRYDDLPDELRDVLERSLELDINPEKDRKLEARAVEARTLEPRSVVMTRSLAGHEPPDPRPGRKRWDALGREQQAGLLNLFSKMRSIAVTIHSGQKTTWSQVVALVSVARDRFKAIIETDLRKAVQDAATVFLDKTPLIPLFHPPPAQFSRAGSWKTDEPFGNLQLTFFRSNEDPSAMQVEADIDDAAGLAHGEQVVRNESREFLRKTLGRLIPGLPEGTTHPYDIHQLVVHHQVGKGAIKRYEACYALLVSGASIPFRIKDGPA